MNPGVALVEAYLHLNGYFTQREIPLVREDPKGGFSEATDVDVLAVRFPDAAVVVSRGRLDGADDLVIGPDPALDLPRDAVDVVVGEVKEGKARINDTLRTRETLRTALLRVGCVAPGAVDDAVADLRERGTALTGGDQGRAPARIRLVAFGEGTSGRRDGHTVIALDHVASFVSEYVERHHDILTPATITDPVLGVLHLLRKVRPG